MTGFIKQTLNELFSQIPVHDFENKTLPAIPVTGITFDSRAVQPGFLFFAIVGENSDGHKYIKDAIDHGAVAIIGTQAIIGLSVPYIQVKDSREIMAYCSAAFYNFPARQMMMIGVTGTDGKTTTTNLIFKILQNAGFDTGIISTVNAVIGEEVLDTGLHVTTPEAPEIQRYLSRMLVNGLTHVVLEATSHGLAQHRVTACEFDIAVVTNITHEHLDYHKTYQAYREAKGRLFTSLNETQPKKFNSPKLAVINGEDSSYDYLDSITPGKKIIYGNHGGSDIWAENIHHESTGLVFTAAGKHFHQSIKSQLVGEHNVSNILAAMAAAIYGLEITPRMASEGVEALKGIPGRSEQIFLGQDFTAIVDFAHTPNALKRTLQTMRQLTKGQVIAVFGSAGLRDREKRKMMAEVSIELADITILTAEDPRTESLDDILAEMAGAAAKKGGKEGQTFWRVPDRGEAIRQAVKMAQKGDVVVSCGKGHEQSMCFGTIEYPWDDRTAMRAALSGLLGIPGPEMPYLPTR